MRTKFIDPYCNFSNVPKASSKDGTPHDPVCGLRPPRGSLRSEPFGPSPILFPIFQRGWLQSRNSSLMEWPANIKVAKPARNIVTETGKDNRLSATAEMQFAVPAAPPISLSFELQVVLRTSLVEGALGGKWPFFREDHKLDNNPLLILPEATVAGKVYRVKVTSHEDSTHDSRIIWDSSLRIRIWKRDSGRRRGLTVEKIPRRGKGPRMEGYIASNSYKRCTWVEHEQVKTGKLRHDRLVHRGAAGSRSGMRSSKRAYRRD